jgi:hypothetical protein
MFKKIGIFHLPNNLLGYTIFALFILFLINVFVAIDRNSHSVSDTLYGIFPYFVSTFLLYEWLAEKTSQK